MVLTRFARRLSCASRGALFIFFLVSEGLWNPIFAQEATFPAKGFHEVPLVLKDYGYYRISVASGNGMGLELVDRVRGPVARSGNPGSLDGRIDVLLEAGEYRVRLVGPDNGEGNGNLFVNACSNTTAEPLVLAPGAESRGSLGDGESVAFWVKAETGVPLVFEAQGRCLGRIAFWKDGTFVAATVAVDETREVEKGKPCGAVILAPALAEGWYQVVCYGGPTNKWSQEDGTTPLRVRLLGRPRSLNFRMTESISTFGVNRYLVESGSRTLALQSEKAEGGYTLGFTEVRPGALPTGRTAAIPPDARLPQCTMAGASVSPGRLGMVTVSGPVGRPIWLQSIEPRTGFSVTTPGNYFMASIPAGFPADRPDATAVLVDRTPVNGRTAAQVVANECLAIPQTSYRRPYNFDGPHSYFIEATEAVDVGIEVLDVSTRLTLERFFLERPKGYIGVTGTDRLWARLEPGIHVLRLNPMKPGIGTFHLFRSNAAGGDGTKTDLPRPGLVWQNLELAPRTYTLAFGAQGSGNGMVLRKWPIDLSDPLCFSLAPGQGVSIDVEVTEPSVLRMNTEGSNRFGAWLGSRPVGDSVIPQGVHRLAVTNQGDGAEFYSVASIGDAFMKSGGKTPFKTVDRMAFPEYEVVAVGQDRFADLERGLEKIFRVEVPRDGLYTLETTGRLSLAVEIRSRLVPSLFRGAKNGAGGNGSLTSFLGKGPYQITVNGLEGTAGRFGVRLMPTAIRDGGGIASTGTRALRLQDGEAGMYDLTSFSNQALAILSVRQGAPVRWRLVDDDGFPLRGLDVPMSGPFQGVLPRGRGRLILLPEAIGDKVVTAVERILEEKTFTGKGPFLLSPNVPLIHSWEEEGPGRTPDAWRLEIPAAMEADIRLSAWMKASLFRMEGTRAVSITDIYPREGEIPAPSGLLKVMDFKSQGQAFPVMFPGAGTYLLKVFAKRAQGSIDYGIGLETPVLARGISQMVSTPGELSVSVEEEGTYRITSKGAVDTVASLYQTDGTWLAMSDDDGDDWNFRIERALPKGRYRLEVVSHATGSGNETGTTWVTMEAVTNGAAAANPQVAATTLPMGKGDGEGKTVTLHPPAPVILETQGIATGALVLVKSAGGSVMGGAARSEGYRLSAPFTASRDGHTVGRTAVFATRPGEKGLAWGTDVKSSQESLTVRALALTGATGVLPESGGQIALPPRTLRTYQVPRGIRSARVILPEDTAACAWNTNGVQVVRVGMEGGASSIVNLAGALASFANFSEKPVAIDLEPFETRAGERAFFYYEKVLASVETIDFTGPIPTKPCFISFTGDGSLSLFDNQGRVKEYGPGLRIPVEGDYLTGSFTARSGHVKAWLGERPADRWGPFGEGDVVSLGSRGAVKVDPFLWVGLTNVKGSVVVLSGSKAFSACVADEGSVTAAAESDGEGICLLPIPPKPCQVGLRSVDGPQVVEVKPVSPMDLGKVGEITVARHREQVFEMNLAAATEAVVGYRGMEESPTLSLFDSKGNRLARGKMMLTAFSAGKYFVLVSTDSETPTALTPFFVKVSDIEKSVYQDAIRAFLKN